MDYKSKVKELIEYPREANWYEFKCTITDRSGMILLHKSEKGHKLTLFSQK